MESLIDSSPYPLLTFLRCQICGKEDEDICEFEMWQECDDFDRPNRRFLIVCREEGCAKQLEDHLRLYVRVEWGRGDPGHLMLLCGPCQYRQGTSCSHPSLKANGGEGLEIHIQNEFTGASAIICYHGEDEDLKCRRIMGPMVKCLGFKRIEGHKGASHE